MYPPSFMENGGIDLTGFELTTWVLQSVAPSVPATKLPDHDLHVSQSILIFDP